MESKENTETKKYKLEEITEMLGGKNKYYSFEQIMFVYNRVNGYEKEAAYYKELCIEKNKLENEEISKLKTEDEIKKIPVEDIKEDTKEDDSDEKLVKIKKK